jgi:hypothetical protein
MRTPLPNNPTEIQIINNILGNSGILKNEESQLTEQIKESFFRNLNYTKVTKNFETQSYDVWIYDGDTKDKDVPYKRLLSYPYQTIQFERGDYVHFTYGNTSTTWLIGSLDSQYLYNVNGRIFSCNNILKWVDENENLIEYPCVVRDKANNGRFEFNNNIIIPKSYVYVDVQTNSDTSKVKEDRRFMFNGVPFRTVFVEKFTAGGIITLTIERDQINTATDNVELNIADYYKNQYEISINQANFEQIVGGTGILTTTLTLNDVAINKPIEWVSSNTNIGTINNNGNYQLLNSGSVTFTARMADNIYINDSINVNVISVSSGVKENKIEPQILEIKQNTVVDYTVFSYLDNIAQSDVFSIMSSGVNSSKYVLTITDGNHFSVKSLGYDSVPLVVQCTNLIDSTTTSISIQLKGLW